jgi:UDP-N-acetylglucosamine:LPS N-acetylglucosamine transferase
MQANKTKVLLIGSNNGGGHVAAAQAVVKALSAEQYDIQQTFPCESLPGDELYNQFMKKGDFLAASLLVRMQVFAEVMSPFLQSKLAIKQAVESVQPDLIISVIPVNNHVTLAIAKKKNIPMFVIPTDITFAHFFHLIHNPPANFKVLVPFSDCGDIQKLIKEQGFKNDNFVVTGYPLREEFAASPSKKEAAWEIIKTELGLAVNDKVITLMMGAQGSSKQTKLYVRRMIKETARICKAGSRTHLIVMCGENKSLRRELQNLHTISHLKIHALDRRDGNYVAALLHHTDIFITKPGGSSVNEALCSEVFTIFEDSSAKKIWWEYDNMMFAVGKGCAQVVDKHHFGQQLKSALRRTTRPAVETVPGRHFCTNLLTLVELSTFIKCKYL